MLASTVWLSTLFKISCFQQQKEIHRGLKQLDGELMMMTEL